MSVPAHRLSEYELKRRIGKFLALVADGTDPEQAVQEAGLPLKHAFRVVSKPGYEAAVAAVRASGDPVAVQLTVNTHKSAA